MPTNYFRSGRYVGARQYVRDAFSEAEQAQFLEAIDLLESKARESRDTRDTDLRLSTFASQSRLRKALLKVCALVRTDRLRMGPSKMLALEQADRTTREIFPYEGSLLLLEGPSLGTNMHNSVLVYCPSGDSEIALLATVEQQEVRPLQEGTLHHALVLEAMSDLPNNLAVASAARLQPLTATLTVRDGVPFRGTISLVETLNGRYLSTWYRSVPASSEGKVQFEGRPSEFQLNIQDAQGVPIAVVPGGTLKPELTDVLLEKNMRMRLEHSVGTEQEESGLEIRYND